MCLPELPWGDLLPSLRPEDVARLAGNGMFMPTVLYQLLYVLSRLQQRSQCPFGRANSLQGIEEGFEWDVE